MQKIKKYLLVIILLLGIIPAFSQVVSFRLTASSESQNIFASSLYGAKWMSLNHFFKTYGEINSINTEDWTLTATLSGKEYIFYANSTFYQINGKWYHLPTTVERLSYGLYIPEAEFIRILKQEAFPKVQYNPADRHYILSPSDFSIIDITLREMKNGTIVRIKTNTAFRKEHCRVWQGNNQYLYVSIYGASANMNKLSRKYSAGVIREIIPIMAKDMLQFNVKMRMKIDGLDYFIDPQSGDIVISLRHSYQKSTTPISETQIKNRWMIDTIVIDPGHGGKKSPGAIAPDGTMEKNIALDVSLRLGRLLESKLGVKVVYTREKDIFVPLWQRPKIANEAGGKLFISIHCNSVESSRPYGTETYLLSPKSTEKSIEIAARENKVIELEEDQERYKKLLSPEQYILSTMAQSVYMKDSEALAQAVESNYKNRMGCRTRGVKQASFIVLIGPAMPAILTEIGFISNWGELKNLKKDSYRQEIAYSLYLAIRDFKKNQEREIKDH
ncbi:MAG: N-acetylmuramoyl-L-alanine amidase [Candidatus Marinimicrobia bacterium]|nr:N-acetylmuramoyl-L-alanine amidase [Candidatus Neomarinimicrobiota bacterium]